MDEDAMIREVDPDKAEAVLTIRFFIPGVIEGGEDRYYLSRTSRPFNYVVESVTVNPDGSITERGRSTSAGETFAHASHANGRTADGRGFGHGKTVFIQGQSAEEVAIQLSMYWTARDGSCGNLDEELVVPWLGTSRKELGGGAWVAAEITPIEDTA